MAAGGIGDGSWVRRVFCNDDEGMHAWVSAGMGGFWIPSKVKQHYSF